MERLLRPRGAPATAIGIAAAYGACALIVLLAAACTRGVDSAADRDGSEPPLTSETGWAVSSLTAGYSLRPDGAVEVVERIEVDFQFVTRHGIYRDLYWRTICRPPRIAAETALGECPADRLRTFAIDVQGVTNESGAAVPIKVSTVGDTRRIRIGDPNRLVSGRQTYVLRYTVRGALDAYSGHDELYWNASGRWPVPTVSFSATVRLPSGRVAEALCFQGIPADSRPCEAAIGADGSATYTSAGPIVEATHVTLVASFPRGIVVPGAPQIWREPVFGDFYRLDVIEIGGAILAALLAAAVVAGLWGRVGRDRQYRTLYYLTRDPAEGRRPLFGGPVVVPELVPPDGLRPAQMGVLLDASADTLDVTATIVDLAVRGYLRIEEVAEAGDGQRARDWRLVRLKKGEGELLPYERTLLGALFSVNDGGAPVLLADLKRGFREQCQDVQEKLYGDASLNRWFEANPERVRRRWRRRGLLVALAGLPLAYAFGLYFGRALVLNAVPAAGLALMVLSPAMVGRTARGSEALRRVLGFRLYIETAEKRRQEFHEEANIFARYLPYAIVFGSVTKWARAFEGLDRGVRESLEWYSGSGAAGIGATAFSVHLALLAHTMSGTLVAEPITTAWVASHSRWPGGGGPGGGSGFSGGAGLGDGAGGAGFGGGFGGGFAGGGGGGGGGGSW